MSELQRCPFCGADEAQVSGSSGCRAVICYECGARGPESLVPEGAIRFWNERVLPPLTTGKRYKSVQDLEDGVYCRKFIVQRQMSEHEEAAWYQAGLSAQGCELDEYAVEAIIKYGRLLKDQVRSLAEKTQQEQ